MVLSVLGAALGIIKQNDQLYNRKQLPSIFNAKLSSQVNVGQGKLLNSIQNKT